MEERGRTARSDGFALDPFAGLSRIEGAALNKRMAALGRFLLALGGGVFGFFLLAIVLPLTTESLSGLRAWYGTILFVFVLFMAAGGTLILLDRRRALERRRSSRKPSVKEKGASPFASPPQDQP